LKQVGETKVGYVVLYLDYALVVSLEELGVAEVR
jgi:hypothetical protein